MRGEPREYAIRTPARPSARSRPDEVAVAVKRARPLRAYRSRNDCTAAGAGPARSWVRCGEHGQEEEPASLDGNIALAAYSGWAANLFDVVAEPHRRQILDALCDGDRSVTELVELLGLAQPTASKHLKTLREARLVVVRPEAQKRWYRLSPSRCASSTTGRSLID